jgi:pilus assembly protein Flp/PilA
MLLTTLAYQRSLTYLREQLARQEGQALVEYALILSLIAVASVVIMGLLGGQISTMFTTISNDI